ncbi:HipA-like protein [Porphyromonas gingivalis A7A1-28]|nr:HipA-like protein [Porphyromonas gingivalis A7A1-28]SJL33942.1 toxin HipA [Porphyromonas gingivalis]
MMNRCLYCYEPLVDREEDYHAKCCRKLFGMPQAPILPYTSSEVRALADEVVRSQTTVTGVQPKLFLDFDQMSHSPKRFTIVGLWGRFILKPQTERYPHLPELEDVSMHLAEIAKIETVPHGLMRFSDGELCYITRRIDRTGQGEKLPMEDMCQLSERLTEYKYKGSHEQIAKLITKYSSVPKLDLVKYWEQVLFSWLIGNADMHLKNYSLYAPIGNEYQLTPAYDLLSTSLVIPEDTEELALTLCGKKRKLTRQHFLEAMTASGLDEKVCDNIFARFQRILPEWETCIRQSFLPGEMQRQYIEFILLKFSQI